ncbi:MAG: trypsin-like peptidase domain-containing protein [Verrucomicrobiota bacterium]
MNFRPSRVLSAAFYLLALALLGSCKSTEISDEEQSASLTPYSDLEIDGESLESFFRERSATIIGAEGLEIIDQAERPSSHPPEEFEPSFSLRFDQSKPFFAGTAFAIDPRGYFLTAGHCVKGRETYACFVNKEKRLVIRRVRPVWVKIASITAIDLALFHVEGTPLETFEWADSFAIGEPVFSAGSSFAVKRGMEPPFQFTIDAFAGEMKKISYQSFERTQFQILQHKSPVRRGNSGGPIVTEKGGLIGVNYAAATSIQRTAGAEVTPMSYALRPDPQWIRNLIEKDWAAQHAR